MRLTVLVMLVGVLSLVSVVASQAGATFDVNTTDDTVDATPGDGTCADAGGKCSLRAAVEEANALTGADTINVPLGEYHVASTLVVDDSVTIIGAGKASTVLDLSGLPVFLASSDLSLSEVGFVGSITAIRTEAGVSGPVNLTVDSVAFTGNSFMSIQGDTVALVTNSTFDNGGIIVNGEEFDGPVNLTVRDSSFTSSSTGSSIGVADIDTPVTVTITRSSFIGAGLRLLEAGSSLDVTVSRSTFSSSNGFNFRGTTLDVENSTLVDMSSQAIFAHTGAVTLNHVTVEGVVAAGGSVITFTNSIVTQVDGTEDACETRDDGSVVSGGGNIATDDTCNLTATNDQPNTDPLFGALADNGGPTLTRLPAGGSPAIGAALSGPCLGVDQRGLVRPSGSGCDVGAVEVQVPVAIEALFCVGDTGFEFTVVRRGLSVDTTFESMLINADGLWTDVTGPEATEQIFVQYGFNAGAGPIIVNDGPTAIFYIKQNVTPPDRWNEGSLSGNVSAVEVQDGIWDVTFSGTIGHGPEPFSSGDVVRQTGATSVFAIDLDVENTTITECELVTTTTAAATTTAAPTTTTVAATSSTLPATGIGDAVRISAPLGLGLLLAGALALGGAALIGDRRRRQ